MLLMDPHGYMGRMEAPANNTMQLTSTLLTAGLASLLGVGALLQSPGLLAAPVPMSQQKAPPPAFATAPVLASGVAPSREEPVRVLVLGDSHAASTFGRALDLLLRSRANTEVTTVGSCGVAPEAFLRGTPDSRCGYLQIEAQRMDWQVHKAKAPSLAQLLNQTQPELTVIELGANQLSSAWRDPVQAAADIRELAERVTTFGSKCVWVGPPYGAPKQKPARKIDNVYDLLAQELKGRCELIDSRPAQMPFLDYEQVAASAHRKGDGRHFDTIGVLGQQAARHWALAVFNALRPQLNALEVPSDPVFGQTQGALVVSAAR